MLTDVMSGQVHLIADPMASSLPLAASGKIKALAVTSMKRVAAAPDIPTIAESGMTGFDFSSWYGLWGPKGLPADITAKLQSRGRQGAGAARHQGAPRDARLRDDRIDRGGVRQVHRRGIREVRTDHPGREDQGGVKFSGCMVSRAAGAVAAAIIARRIARMRSSIARDELPAPPR